MLLHNPVADLSSYQFLIFYATVCALVVAVSGWLVRAADATTASGPEPMPRTLDPYEIAYLRGDLNELVRFAVFELMRRGALELVPGQKRKAPQIRRTEAGAAPEGLSPVAQAVYGYFAEPHTAEELFESDVPASVAAVYAGNRRALEARRLFAVPDAKAAARSARLVGTIVIAGLAAYRLWYAAMLHHRNVLFLIAIGAVALALLFLVTFVPRLSKRGLQYLRTLRGALPASRDRLMPASESFPLIIAAGGMTALAGTPYAGLNTTFRKQAAASGSSSSGGCGSGGYDASGSSCSSGSCGGGGCGG